MRLLSYDPITRTRDVFHDLGNGKYVVESIQDVEDVVEDAKANSLLIPHKASQKFKGDGFHKVGTIPMDVLAKNPHFYHDGIAVMKWLDENSVFKHMPVSLSK